MKTDHQRIEALEIRTEILLQLIKSLSAILSGQEDEHKEAQNKALKLADKLDRL